MHISLDNINFYSHPPPAKSPPRAFPVSRWRPYETPLAPQALSHTPLPRLPSPRTTTTLASDARSIADPGFRTPTRENPDLCAVPNEFDIEIEEMAMAQNGSVAQDADLDIHCDLGLLNGPVTDVTQSQRTFVATGHPDRRPLVDAASNSDPACTPAEPDLHYFGPSFAPTDKLDLPRDSTVSFRSCDKSDKDPTPPEGQFPCERIPPLPSPGSLGSRHPQAGPVPETRMRDESVVDDTKTGPESCGDSAGDPIDGLTIQSVQVNGPSVREASPDNDGRLTEESQPPAPPGLRSRICPAKRPKFPLTSTRSLRPRPYARSTKSERLPAVSVVIPTRQTDELVANITMNSPTRAQHYDHWGDRNSSTINHDRPTRAVTREYSPFSGGSRPKARGRPRKRPKRTLENTTTSASDIIGKCTNQSQSPLDSGFAVGLGETQEIFGRGVLRIQSHGPRHAYFMTFLPEAPHQSSLPTPPKMPPYQSSRLDDTTENKSSRQVACGERHKRTKPTICEDGDVWSGSTNGPRTGISKQTSLSKGDQLLIQLKEQQKLSWNEIAKHFPGKSRGSLQVRYSTRLKRRNFGNITHGLDEKINSEDAARASRESLQRSINTGALSEQDMVT
ncbi:hypothetical protein N7492_006755 [Penicillium capsulatum]|uniref:Myb-like domain-containing protein n=1 Tax=Penicillium capsulatum TaxID=69766 RepID=A0A9W9HYL4_9EURO|nr:hypothetical protein N7492_006755 [Penicillium capsulatum]KAJ6116591.1 hypothetical protein N7512_006316 [Penicillium capsulatum]